jgi:hypothetical protein
MRYRYQICRRLIEIPFTFDAENPEHLPGCCFPPTIMKVIKAAFTAAEMGMKVERLVEDYSLLTAANSLQGVFIASHRNLDKLLEDLLVQPVF